MLMVEKQKIYWAYEPKSWAGAAMTAKYVSLKNYNHLTVIIQSGANAGARAIHMHKATNVSAGSAENLRITRMWTDIAVAGTLVETVVAANTFNINTANSIWVIEIDAADLMNDALTPFAAETLAFDCVCLEMDNQAGADFVGVLYILSEPRFGVAADALAD
jgi:hypothetical protein